MWNLWLWHTCWFKEKNINDIYVITDALMYRWYIFYLNLNKRIHKQACIFYSYYGDIYSIYGDS